MRFLAQLFTWWSGQTLGTRLFTWRYGRRVGADEYGNVYYETKDAKRRWVIYAANSEASRVPSSWHGWLHHSFDNNPAQNPLVSPDWALPHQENLSGTVQSFARLGSQYREGTVNPGYEAWMPK